MNEAIIAPIRHKLDVDAYFRIAEAGIFGENDRIELIGGELIDLAPIGQAHAAAVDSLAEALYEACRRRAIVSSQNPVRLDDRSAPQPDLVVLKRRPDFYATGDYRSPADVLLLVEVSDSSLSFDRDIKLPLYAQAGIGELWIVDLKLRIVEAYRTPVEDGYAQKSTHSPGERIALALAPEIIVQLDLVFG